VATYSSYNDATEEEEETTIKTHERPRPKFFLDRAEVARTARDYFKLGELAVADPSRRDPRGLEQLVHPERVDLHEEADRLGEQHRVERGHVGASAVP
jgi:hypothetical protein